MGISAAPIVIVTVAVSLPVVLLAVTMNAVDDIVVVGVPLKRPVVVEKVIPLGSDGGASIDQLLMTPPVLVGIKVEIAEFTFPDNAPDEGYEISGAKSPDEVTTVIEVAAVLFWPALSTALFAERPITKFPADGVEPPVPGTNSTV